MLRVCRPSLSRRGRSGIAHWSGAPLRGRCPPLAESQSGRHGDEPHAPLHCGVPLSPRADSRGAAWHCVSSGCGRAAVALSGGSGGCRGGYWRLLEVLTSRRSGGSWRAVVHDRRAAGAARVAAGKPPAAGERGNECTSLSDFRHPREQTPRPRRGAARPRRRSCRAGAMPGAARGWPWHDTSVRHVVGGGARVRGVHNPTHPHPWSLGKSCAHADTYCTLMVVCAWH